VATRLQEFYDDSRELYERWHNKGRNLYAVTPRYAPGASPELLAKAGQLYRELPGAYMNTVRDDWLAGWLLQVHHCGRRA
jgi:cytosine/adenosine deaminase-related metal-dependent hydrolase